VANADADLMTAGICGGAMSSFGAAVRALQKPQKWRSFAVTLGIGFLFGATAVVCLRWRYPDVPFEVAICAGGWVGFVSSHLSQVVFKLSDAAIDKVGSDVAAGKIGAIAPMFPPVPIYVPPALPSAGDARRATDPARPADRRPVE